MIRYHARWVLPVSSAPLRDATVAVEGNSITWVGPRRDAPPGADVDLGDAIITPGFVNAHVHLDLSAFAGALPRASFFRWVRTLVDGLANAADSTALNDVARWTIAQQLAQGVTTMAHTGPHASTLDAMHELGARGVVFIEVFGPDPSACRDAMKTLREKVDNARARETSLARVGVSPHAPYSVSDALYSAVAGYAITDRLPVAVHIAESRDETDLVRNGAGEFAAFLAGRGIDVRRRASSPVELLERTGVLRSQPLCIHAIQLDDQDIQRIASADAPVVHCPRANKWLGHDRARVSSMVDAGIRVGLGTDSAASNEGLDLMAEARDAEGAMSAAQRLALATTGGAQALGIGGSVGALRAGFQADLAAFRIRDVRACDADPVSYVLDQSAEVPALLAVVAGNVRARDGVVEAVDPGLDARMQEHRVRVRAWRDGVADGDNTFLDSKP